MKTLTNNEMTSISAGTSANICEALAGIAIGGFLSGGFLVGAIAGTAFLLACTKGDS